ncbi:MAG: GAF domain-containing protein, partial [Chloroflexi bacterium]|nr:GAF domain-containing protein [Chloroflexota bacterium]
MRARRNLPSQADPAVELDAARRMLRELQARTERLERSETVQAALYRIAETASSASDMATFYAAIHDIVGELMYADNFYIALYDDRRGLVNYPFFHDEVDPEIPDPTMWEPMGEGQAAGFTAYVLRTGTAVLIDAAEQRAMVNRGEVTALGLLAVDWMAAPLEAGGHTIGVVVVQSYQEERSHSAEDLEVLSFVAQHIATALTRARAIEETRQRNEELGLINEIGAALARQLEFSAIVDLVGERIRSIFDVQTGSVALYDADTNQVSLPYTIEDGERGEMAAWQLGPGLMSEVITTRTALRLNTAAETEARGAITFGKADAQSWLGVPVLVGERVLGVIALERPERFAFTESDERLLGTLASSTGVALENARLFDETKRLLGETSQRNAELAVVNEIGAALAKQLDLGAIVELVGERIRQMFDTNSIFIGLYDEAASAIHFPYSIEENEVLPMKPVSFGEGLTSQVIRSKRALRLGSAQEANARGAITTGQVTQSWLGVPILAGDRAIGVIGLESMDQDVYTESDERLLGTLASSMGVALENARLFGETKRLLTETDERAAELAIINSVQEGLAQNLEMQAMYDLVGDKIQEIFDAQVVDIGIYDTAAATISFPYTIERGVRFPDEAIRIADSHLSKTVLETRQPIHVRDVPRWLAETNVAQSLQGEQPQSLLLAPLVVAGEVRGRISIQNLDRIDAFSESDVRLLTTLASSLSVALENARLFDETRRLLTETDRRAAELAIVNSVQRGLSSELDVQAMYELVGERATDVFDANVVDIAIFDRDQDLMRFPFIIERGVRFDDHPG